MLKLLGHSKLTNVASLTLNSGETKKVGVLSYLNCINAWSFVFSTHAIITIWGADLVWGSWGS
jgi:hypothetical protein